MVSIALTLSHSSTVNLGRKVMEQMGGYGLGHSRKEVKREGQSSRQGKVKVKDEESQNGGANIAMSVSSLNSNIGPGLKTTEGREQMYQIDWVNKARCSNSWP